MKQITLVFLLILLSCKDKVKTDQLDLNKEKEIKFNKNEPLPKDSSQKVVDTLFLKNEKEKFLLAFYEEYITELSASSINLEQINLIKSKYCTPKLLNKLLDEELDFDPFLDAQDIDKEILKTLKVTEDSLKNNFIISYSTGFQDEIVEIKLNLLLINNELKINDILETDSVDL